MADAATGVLMLHGMGCGPWVWRDVVAALPSYLTPVPAVIAGHRGGTPLQRRSARTSPEQMLDDLEDQLDALGIQRIHVVGNSLGGWLALRLAERGRALSTLCLAPAGGWHPGSLGERLVVTRFALGQRAARGLNRRPGLLTRPHIRRSVLAPVAHDPQNITLEDALAFVRDLAACQALEIALGNSAARRLGLVRAVGAPTTVAWSSEDRVLSGPWARVRFRHLAADVIEIPDVGHLPMLDDPGTVADLIEARIATALGAS